MKPVAGALLVVAMTAGCGGVAPAVVETPQQVVSTASQKMSQLQSAKFDLSATVLEQFPSSFTQSLGPQGAALSNLSIDVSGNGEANFPDKAAMSIKVKTGSITISTEIVMIGDKVYLKDPQTGAFTQLSSTSSPLQFGNETDPLSGAAILKTAQSVKDLGDTTVNGVAVHHYQVIPDKAKLAAQASTQQARDLLQSVLQNGSVRLEVWIGKDDHLLHRLKDDTDATVDLNQALQAMGQQLPAGESIPAGATVHTVAHSTLDYRDFNAPVTVTPPAVSPS